ncbi:MAG: hypothetical protein KGL39_47260 [Patescibacteria group bacterium]|nr:hypothetical protein [Patescibacteria group bacterium]
MTTAREILERIDEITYMPPTSRSRLLIQSAVKSLEARALQWEALKYDADKQYVGKCLECDELLDERDALKAKIAEMEKQEPAVVFENPSWNIKKPLREGDKLYLAAGAKEQL